MTGRRAAVRVYASLHIDGDADTRVQPIPEYDHVVVHLDHGAALHLDRDGIAVLQAAMERARVELDAAQDEMAAAIEAEQATPRAERISA